MAAQSIEVETHRVAGADAAKWSAPVAVGPVDTRDRFDVWVRAKDDRVLAFRVTVRYQVGQSVTAESRIAPNNIEHGAIVQIRLSDQSAQILSVTIGRLVEQESSDVPIS